jgi:hypothetical protein
MENRIIEYRAVIMKQNAKQRNINTLIVGRKQ